VILPSAATLLKQLPEIVLHMECDLDDSRADETDEGSESE
jgi:hypothetical protein